MLSYITLGTNNLEKAVAFYTDLLQELSATPLIKMDRLVLFGKNKSEPMLGLCIPFNKEDATPGNGVMVSLGQRDKTKVDKLYAKAIALGATCEGEPGQRIPDMFYGAYVRDLDGNKLCFCHFG
ncbi:VOC family protein [Paraglaciecola sp.]|uniref:VOC family protein n=1 Tax=Paraglaciecola sp. TaxID=1920173 RepID=UPI0030F42628